SRVELWRTDGNNAGTILLEEINPGAPASNPRLFQNFKNMTLFAATNGATGEEIWKTDGTAAGTVILKDINSGAQSSTFVNIELAPGIFYPVNVFYSFHEFNNLAFFTAVDANGAGGIWRTDGTELNTVLVKEMTPNAASLQNIFYLMFDAFNLPGKFIFPYVEVDTKGELWESDGTAAGTKLFKTFPLSDDNNFPVVYVNYGYNAATQTLSYPLYNGKFFFTAETANG